MLVLRTIVRALVLIVLGIVRWLAAFLAILAGIVVMLRAPGSWLAQLPRDSWPHAVAAGALLLLSILLLAGLLLLLLHPGRMPHLLLAPILAPLRRLRLRRPPALPDDTSVGSDGGTESALPGHSSRPLSRRRFLVESVAVGLLVSDAVVWEPHWLEFTRVDIPIRRLPRRFHGFTLAQLSDLHISPFTTTERLASLIARINALHADVIVVTGDFVDFEARYAEPTAQVLRGLRAPEGIYTILGNHDYYAGADQVAASLVANGLGLLRNTHTVLRRGADKLYLLGADDPTHTPRLRSHADLPRTLRGTAPDAPRILLVHNPILAPAVVAAQIDLGISGHTHGGQVRVPYLTDRVLRRIEYIDHGRYTWGETQFYVNRGYGTIGPPIRFRCRPEVTLLRLVPAA